MKQLDVITCSHVCKLTALSSNPVLHLIVLQIVKVGRWKWLLVPCNAQSSLKEPEHRPVVYIGDSVCPGKSCDLVHKVAVV